MEAEGLIEAAASLKKAILEGDTEKGLKLVDHFPNETLSSHLIQNKWALHCLHPVAFQDGGRLEFTKQVILKYIGAGWTVDSKSSLEIYNATRFVNLDFYLTRYTLLHLACIHKCPEVIKLLVEEAGADINCLTAGKAELTPLHILLMLHQWESARFLVERRADLSLAGSIKKRDNYFSGFANNDDNLKSHSSLNPLELLLRMGHQAGLPVLNQILARTEDVAWQGVKEFQLALEGLNLNFLTKVLQYCPQMISTEELSWITLVNWDTNTRRTPVNERVPSLLWLLHSIHRRLSKSAPEVERGKELGLATSLANLINIFVERGYNLNRGWGRSGLFCTEPPLLFFALRIDALLESNILLRTLLQVDQFQLSNVYRRGGRGRCNPVHHLLHLYNKRCLFRDPKMKCWESKMTSTENPVAAVELLVTHGMDVTGLVIGLHGVTKYHCGYKPMIQMLYTAGARISDSFFSKPPSCESGAAKEFGKEVSELKEWKEEFDQRNRMSLKNMCRLRVRKMLTSVGDLKMLDQLPVHLKDAVLCKIDI